MHNSYVFNEYQIASILSRAILYSCLDAEWYFTSFNMDWVVLWTLVHAFSWSTFSLLLARKFQQVKLVFQHLQRKFFQWVHHIYLLALCYSKYVYHVICVIYTSKWKWYLIYCNGKSWLKSSRELDAHFTFIAFNKHEPLWLILWW